MSLILDTSVTMRWCFGDGTPSDLDYAARVSRMLRNDSAEVPGIWGLEVANVLARAERHGQIDATHSASFLGMLKRLRIAPDPDTAEHALAETLTLARRHHLSAYDAAYLELALRKRLPLATLDGALRDAAKQAGVKLFA